MRRGNKDRLRDIGFGKDKVVGAWNTVNIIVPREVTTLGNLDLQLASTFAARTRTIDIVTSCHE